jgi:hypothetical protein
MDNDRTYIPGVDISTWPELKFSRAMKLMRELESELHLWAISAGLRYESSVGPSGNSVVVILRTKRNPPTELWSLLMGDMLHNLRSSLDALVWELAHVDGAAPTKPTQVQFPCCSTAAEWDKQVNGPLASLPARAVQRIREVQPIGTSDGTIPLPWLLHRLDIQDKHQSMITSRVQVNHVVIDGMSFTYADPNANPHVEVGGPAEQAAVEDGAVCLQIMGGAPIKDVQGSPKRIGLAWYLEFNGQSFEMLPLLNNLVLQVRGTLDYVTGRPPSYPTESTDAPSHPSPGSED